MGSTDNYEPETKETLFKLALRGVPLQHPDLYQATKQSAAHFGVKPWEERNIFERLFDHASSLVGLQDPRDVRAAKAQDELDKVYAGIYADVQKNPSYRSALIAQGLLKPEPQRSASIVGSAPASEFPGEMPPQGAMPTPSAPVGIGLQAPPEALASPGTPMPPPMPGSPGAVQAQGAGFNSLLRDTATVTPDILKNWQNSQSLPIPQATPPAPMGAPMIAGLPPVPSGVGYQKKPAPLWINGQPTHPGQEAAMEEIRAPIDKLMDMQRALPVNIYEDERTGIYSAADAPTAMTLRQHTEKERLDREAKRLQDNKVVVKGEAAWNRSIAMGMDPSTPTIAGMKVVDESLESDKTRHSRQEQVFKQAGERANMLAGLYKDHPAYKHLKDGPLFTDLTAQHRLEVAEAELASAMKITSGEAKVLDKEMAVELAGYFTLQGVLGDLETMGPDRLEKYVGPIDARVRRFFQPALRDKNFSEYRALLAQVMVAQFQTAGKNFTEMEKEILKKSLPTGDELTLNDYMAKIKITKRVLNDIIEHRMKLITTPRDQLQGAGPNPGIAMPSLGVSIGGKAGNPMPPRDAPAPQVLRFDAQGNPVE
jgi:hypothetical protein